MGSLQLAFCEQLNHAKKIHIVSNDTDLVMGINGRKWLSFSGEANLPDGEVASAPEETEVNGHIKFSEDFWFSGIRIRDLILWFKDGQVVDFSASEGAEFVAEVLGTDLGSRTLGEIGIGTNPNMKTFTGDLLLDEKILGTVHIALGRAYPDSLGINESALHWDIVKDLREKGGFLYVDDVAIISDGQLSGPLAKFQSLNKT
jgi:aminopeptidase